VIGDVRLPDETRQALCAAFDYEEAHLQTIPLKFACPSLVQRAGETKQRRHRDFPALGRRCGGGLARGAVIPGRA